MNSTRYFFPLLAIVALWLCIIANVHAATNHDSFTFVAYGDTRSQDDIHRQTIALTVKNAPEFVLQTGDLVNHGSDPQEWATFDSIIQPLRDNHIAYYPARGDHDLGDYYIKRVSEPFDSGNGYYYAFTRHNLRIISVDSFEDYSVGSDQYIWLISQLAEAQAKKQFIIPFFHEAPFSVGPHGSNAEAQALLHPLFVKYHVPLVFAGHDHLYYHTIRDGVTYVVTGGGGAPLYPPVNTQNAIPGDVYKSVYHIVRCDVTGNLIHCTAIQLDGTVIDSFTVNGP